MKVYIVFEQSDDGSDYRIVDIFMNDKKTALFTSWNMAIDNWYLRYSIQECDTNTKHCVIYKMDNCTLRKSFVSQELAAIQNNIKVKDENVLEDLSRFITISI